MSQADKLDPEMAASMSCRLWVNESLDKIRSQKELVTADLETLQLNIASKSKKKLNNQHREELEFLQEKLKNHQFHIQNLELVLGGWTTRF